MLLVPFSSVVGYRLSVIGCGLSVLAPLVPLVVGYWLSVVGLVGCDLSVLESATFI